MVVRVDIASLALSCDETRRLTDERNRRESSTNLGRITLAGHGSSGGSRSESDSVRKSVSTVADDDEGRENG